MELCGVERTRRTSRLDWQICGLPCLPNFFSRVLPYGCILSRIIQDMTIHEETPPEEADVEDLDEVIPLEWWDEDLYEEEEFEDEDEEGAFLYVLDDEDED